ncbi:MAG: hypothetical protein GY679_00170 [Mycoplasma sp.]|nr:hypothetical protein [Mycoplasma sp.]
MIYEEDLEIAEREHYATLDKGREVARSNNMNLTKFKNEIKQWPLTTNSEDQWTFDYESFLGAISNGIYKTPTKWAEQCYYG